MNAKEFATAVRELIEEQKSKGITAISSDNLIGFLNAVENSHELEPTLIELETYKADLQRSIGLQKSEHESNLEMFRSVITSGQNAIKSSFLLNGGAAIAMLAFIGHLAEIAPEKVSNFGCALLPFTLGVLAISVTSGFTYLSQWFYSEEDAKFQKLGFIFNVTCIILALASYIFFVWGMLGVQKLFLNFH